MSTNATLKPADVKVSKISAATLASFIRHNDAIASVETAGKASVEDVKWQALTNLVDAYVIVGNDASALCKLAKVNTGDKLAKAFRDEASPVYVATDQRSELPTATRMSNAMALAERHNDKRMNAYRTATDDAGNTNSARLQDYVVWLNIVQTGKTSSDKIDTAKMSIAGDTPAKRKVGPLVRIPTATTSSGPATATTVVGFFADILKMSADELGALVSDGPIDVESIPLARRRDVARQLMASVTLAEMTDRLVVTLK
jgi:hypothetical protein